MDHTKTQSGMGLIPMLVFIALLGLTAIVGFRLFPVYLEYYTASSIIKEIADQPGARGQNIRQLWADIDRRFNINQVTDVKRDNVTVVDTGGNRRLALKYEVRTALIGNVDLMISFDRQFPLAE